MNMAGVLILALLLDAALGEPRGLWQRVPHPAVLMGRAVALLEQWLNRGAQRRLKGILAVLFIAGGALVLGAGLSALGGLVSALLAAILLSHRSLVDHLRAVGDGLRLSLGDGRLAVARIVGRDTAQMDQADIARAAIESGAENFSDGVIAPAFWFLLAGLPGLILYKAINTADSMIGYRSERYAKFGWAAARLDDLLNLIPARLSALLIAGAYGQLRHWRAIVTEARRHRSPNAGWPEAAMARGLGIALSGPRSYHGARREYPFVNPEGRRALGPAEIDATCAALWRCWVGVLASAFVLAMLLG